MQKKQRKERDRQWGAPVMEEVFMEKKGEGREKGIFEIYYKKKKM